MCSQRSRDVSGYHCPIHSDLWSHCRVGFTPQTAGAAARAAKGGDCGDGDWAAMAIR